MKLIIASELGSSCALAMLVFHRLLERKGRKPFRLPSGPRLSVLQAGPCAKARPVINKVAASKRSFRIMRCMVVLLSPSPDVVRPATSTNIIGQESRQASEIPGAERKIRPERLRYWGRGTTRPANAADRVPGQPLIAGARLEERECRAGVTASVRVEDRQQHLLGGGDHVHDGRGAPVLLHDDPARAVHRVGVDQRLRARSANTTGVFRPTDIAVAVRRQPRGGVGHGRGHRSYRSTCIRTGYGGE